MAVETGATRQRAARRLLRGGLRGRLRRHVRVLGERVVDHVRQPVLSAVQPSLRRHAGRGDDRRGRQVDAGRLARRAPVPVLLQRLPAAHPRSAAGRSAVADRLHAAVRLDTARGRSHPPQPGVAGDEGSDRRRRDASPAAAVHGGRLPAVDDGIQHRSLPGRDRVAAAARHVAAAASRLPGEGRSPVRHRRARGHGGVPARRAFDLGQRGLRRRAVPRRSARHRRPRPFDRAGPDCPGRLDAAALPAAARVRRPEHPLPGIGGLSHPRRRDRRGSRRPGLRHPAGGSRPGAGRRFARQPVADALRCRTARPRMPLRRRDLSSSTGWRHRPRRAFRAIALPHAPRPGSHADIRPRRRGGNVRRGSPAGALADATGAERFAGRAEPGLRRVRRTAIGR